MSPRSALASACLAIAVWQATPPPLPRVQCYELLRGSSRVGWVEVDPLEDRFDLYVFDRRVGVGNIEALATIVTAIGATAKRRPC